MKTGQVLAFMLSVGTGLLAFCGPASATPYGNSVAAPKAFYAFCSKHPGQCRVHGKSGARVPMDSTRMKQLRSVNQRVNASVREMSDKSKWGKSDIWSIVSPGQSGDCEDFALTKQKNLIAMGWPSSALLVSVVRTRSGEGHAVLTVRTTDGYLVLDNRRSSIREARSTGYYFFTMQSPDNPRHWVRVPLKGPALENEVAEKGRNNSNGNAKLAGSRMQAGFSVASTGLARHDTEFNPGR